MTGLKPEIAIEKWHACLNIPSTEIVRILFFFLFFFYFLVSSALMNRENVAERWIAELFGWCNVHGASNGCSVNVWYNWPVNFCNRKWDPFPCPSLLSEVHFRCVQTFASLHFYPCPIFFAVSSFALISLWRYNVECVFIWWFWKAVFNFWKFERSNEKIVASFSSAFFSLLFFWQPENEQKKKQNCNFNGLKLVYCFDR